MASPHFIDIDSLSQPVSEEAPAGEDLRADPTPNSPYFKIKDARTAARAIERNETSDQTGILVPEWRIVIDLAPDLLSTRSKDLEIAAWYCEAMLRSDGFAGLRDAFLLTARLVETFWDGLYPMPDEDGIETRVAALTGLNGEGGEGTLIQPLRKTVLFLGLERPLAYWHVNKAIEVAKITDPERRERQISEGAATMEEVAAAVSATPPSELATLSEDLKECQAAFRALEQALTDKCGNDAPPSGNIRSTMEQIAETLAYVAKDRVAMARQGDSVEDGGDAAPGAAPAAGAMTGGTGARQTVFTREDAFRDLLRIADFFKSTEPHSPISYTLEELVRRGRMTMPELLAELLPDVNARSQFFTTAGIRPPSE